MDIFNDLNQYQAEAVSYCDGPSLVIAGAGSGKTRVLTYKIAYLLSKNVPAYRILALTFTNKAAAEMKVRIDTLMGNNVSRALWMNTFHSIFSRFLRNEAENLGFTKNFTIYDADDSKNFIKSIIKDFDLDTKDYDPKFITYKISSLKNQLILPQSYENNPEFIEEDKACKIIRFSEIYDQYIKRCRKNNVMDFDDLLLYTNILFAKFPDILEKYQNMFDYILVDEYQDTNFSQYLIIKKLAQKHKRLCVVGDDSQSIYAFRGARIENIFNFQDDYPNYKLFKLEQNYRSTQNIVNLANSLIDKNKNKIPKTIFSQNEVGSKIIIKTLDIEKLEGNFVADKIKYLTLTEHFKYSDFAILYRANYQSRIIEEALRNENIPYRIYGGISFYNRKEIKDVLAYIRLCINNNDIEALKRIINYPSRKIGDVTVEKIISLAVQENITVWELLKKINSYAMVFNSGVRAKLNAFVFLIENFVSKIYSISAYEFICELVTKTGITNELQEDKTPEGVSRFENLQELLNGIKSFCDDKNITDNQELKTIDMFLEQVQLLTSEEEDKDGEKEKVVLMTIHSAKGLEFDNVFIIGLEDGKLPNSKAIEGVMDSSAIEEERRLFYVAITRARKNLFISHSLMGFRYGTMEPKNESRFIKDLNPKFMETSGKKGFFVNNDHNDNDFSFERNNYYKPKNQSIDDINFIKDKNLQQNTTPNFSSPQKLVKASEMKNSGKQTYDNSNLRKGQSVKHEKFGIGTIVEMQYDKIIINFSGEVKTLLLKFAKLELV